MKLYVLHNLVPTPAVAVTPTTGHILGQSLTLQCVVTAVRGITSRVDIVWSDGNMELDRTNDTTATAMSNSLVYRDSYTISQLSETDDGRMIQCEVVINSSPPVMTNNYVILDVMGKYINMYITLFICIFTQLLPLWLPRQYLTTKL